MSSTANELDLHRLTVDEAIPKIEAFLYESYQAGLHRVWIVHGRGSGVLRTEVGRYLGSHPLVESYRPADRHHGGSGATEVNLANW